jgi:ZIP family zinc transporter
MIWLFALATSVSTLLGGLFALRFKDSLHLILSFSAGAVIGVAFFDLMPEALELASPHYGITNVTAVIALGFVAFMILNNWFVIGRGVEGCENEHHSEGVAVASLLVHSFLDGVGIGLAFKVSPAVGLVVGAAVLAHDFSDGINTVGLVLKGEGERPLGWLVADALAPLLGVISTLFFSVPSKSLGILLAVFCGFFLYIGASDLLPESHHGHPVFWPTVMTVAGVGVLFVAVRLAGI